MFFFAHIHSNDFLHLPHAEQRVYNASFVLLFELGTVILFMLCYVACLVALFFFINCGSDEVPVESGFLFS